jgi:type IV fimbrial biogenesis protein FimT
MGVIQMKTKYNGFTLLELMVTIAVASVLVGLAAPTFTDLIKSSQLTTTNNLVVTNLNFARSEAVKRSSKILVTLNSATRSIIVLPTGCNNSSCWLRTSQLPSGYSLLFYKLNNSPITGIAYSSDGTADANDGTQDKGGYIKICTPEKKMNVVAVSPVGHIKTAKDTNNNGIPELRNQSTGVLEDVPPC